MPNRLQLVGQRFGRLMVVADAGTSTHGKSLWSCACDCGGAITVAAPRLMNGYTGSCGCLRVEAARALSKRPRRTAIKHGRSHDGTPEYITWKSMRIRCSPSASKSDAALYYGRGIRVCERWSSFECFFADMGPKPSSLHSIDRIDNDGNYEPSNCRWATPQEQRENSRATRPITIDGVTQSLTQWSRATGVGANTIRERLRRGWSPRDAVSVTPALGNRVGPACAHNVGPARREQPC